MAGRSTFFVLLGCFLVGSLHFCSGLANIQQNQNRLYDFLFNQSSAKWLHTFPICDTSNGTNITYATLDEYIGARNSSLLNVSLMIYFNQLSGLDEKQQSVQAKFSFIMKWKDCRLRWVHGNYAGIKEIVMSARDANIFIPVLSLEERLEDDINWSDSAISIRHDGTVTLQKTDSLTFACDVDVRMYPFDSQDCKATFRSRTYGLKKMNLMALDTESGEGGHLDDYIESDTWTLVGQSCLSSSYYKEVGVTESADPSDDSATSPRKLRTRKDEFAQIVFEFKLQRQPFYEVVNLILPAVVTVVISGCVFFIPPGVTDKVGLSLTILLGMFVFTQLMYDKMPETGSQLPMLSLYFLICIGMICCSCVLAVLTSNMSERREVCMHRWIHRVFMEIIGPRLRPDLFRSAAQRIVHRERLIVRLNGVMHNRVAGNETVDLIDKDETPSANRSNEVQEEEVTKENVGETMRNEWVVLSQVCDRVFLIVHMSVTLLLFVSFIVAGLILMIA